MLAPTWVLSWHRGSRGAGDDDGALGHTGDELKEFYKLRIIRCTISSDIKCHLIL